MTATDVPQWLQVVTKKRKLRDDAIQAHANADEALRKVCSSPCLSNGCGNDTARPSLRCISMNLDFKNKPLPAV